MLCSGLQHAQSHLDTIVRGEPLSNERGQQNVDLAKLSDDLRFHEAHRKHVHQWPVCRVFSFASLR
jgi:hypothetical protein